MAWHLDYLGTYISVTSVRKLIIAGFRVEMSFFHIFHRASVCSGVDSGGFRKGMKPDFCLPIFNASWFVEELANNIYKISALAYVNSKS